MIAFFEGDDPRFEELALAGLSGAVGALPEDPKLRTLLGEAQAEGGQVAEAVGTLRAAVETAAGAEDYLPWDMLGVALHLDGRGQEAEAAFSRALALAPGHATGWAKLGSTLMRQAPPRNAEAAACYRRAVDGVAAAGGAPDARLLYNLGSLHMRLSQSEEAAAMFSEAIAAEPTHVKAMGNLASLRNAAGRFAEGIGLLETALGLEGRQGRLPADLAVALGATHEQAHAALPNPSPRALEEARAAYRQALASHPSHAAAAAKLEALEARIGHGAEL